MSAPDRQPAWRDLQALATDVGQQRVDALFAADDERAQRFCLSAAGITLDYAKQRVDGRVMAVLAQLAEQQGFHAARKNLFAGSAINSSENRAAWHVALRRPDSDPLQADVHRVRTAMRAFVAEIHSGEWRGFTGRTITDVVNIGIGGSDLGPRLVCQALAQDEDGPQAHFVANVDPADLDDTLAGLDPQTTLIIVTSKSFGTAETLANARVARQWLIDAGASEADIAHHFIAVSSNEEAVRAFGITRMFELWDWVGGRFSLWSAVGLSIALTLGMDRFEQLLAGAHAMDMHFEQAPVERNLPAIAALVGIWNRNFLALPGHVVVPYAQRLAALPAYLQQLEMESNGKSVTRDGAPVRVATVPAVWGSVGTNAQHAFFQMLHQGGLAAAVDFMLPLSGPAAGSDERERQRVANCLAQAEALMCGRDSQSLAAQMQADGWSGNALEQQLAARRFDGNRPSSIWLFDRLDAASLGALMAAWEHKVFVQGVIWNINSFDQWGVELGKTMADQLLGELDGRVVPVDHDASTQSLLAWVRGRWNRD